MEDAKQDHEIYEAELRREWASAQQTHRTLLKIKKNAEVWNLYIILLNFQIGKGENCINSSCRFEYNKQNLIHEG